MGFHVILRLLPLLLGLATVAADENRQVLVKEVVLDSAVVDIVYLGKGHESVLVTTKSKKLYFSADSGQSWNEITDKVDPSPSWSVEAERVIVNPADKTVAVLQTRIRETGFPYIYITEDSGRTWRRAWGKHHGLHSWISHPTERSWALVSWWNGNCGSAPRLKGKKNDDENDDSDKPCVHRLMFTKDLGKNFLQLAEYVVQFSWGSKAHDQSNRVYFTSYREKSGDQGRLSLWTTEVDFNFVDIGAKGKPKGKPEESLRHGNKFLVSNEYILVAKVSNEQAQTVHLLVSKNGGKSFDAALLPSGMGELEEKWYTVLDTSEGEVILHLNSDNEGEKDTGRIFISDSGGYKFSQSLVNNVRSAKGDCEFDKVVSLQGVYMANIVVPNSKSDKQTFAEGKEKMADQLEDEAADGSAVDQKHGRGFNKGVSAKSAKEERTIRTVISFDKGGAWKYLKAPKVDSLGKPYECAGKPAEECALHLHGSTSWDFYAPFYSMESSVGIVMGTGNVGSSLRFEPEVTNTYVSRDGGLTWVEAHKGAFIYEFGDHGGLIVMADDLHKTSEVVFTWNEGQSWFDFKVGSGATSTPFDVDNIITEPNLTATTFIMFGTRGEGAGVMYYMAFDALGFPACTGAWAADSVSSDYETWSPSDGSSATDSCLLGAQTTYTRRKQTSQCFNGIQFERPVEQKKCACTEQDYACEMGFLRSVGSTECVYGGPDMMPARLVPAVCSGSYKAPAYRKVAGDKCEGGWRPEQVDVPCPGSAARLGNAKYALAGVLLLGALYVCAGKLSEGRGGSKGFGEFTAKSSWAPSFDLMSLVASLGGFLAMFSSKSRSFGGNSYRPVGKDEFDMDAVGNDASLSDFLDEADYDSVAPNRYGAVPAEERRQERRARSPEERSGPVPGGARAALEPVPKLQAPGGAGPQRFDIGGGDEDLL